MTPTNPTPSDPAVKLLPCPFCGNPGARKEEEYRDGGWAVPYVECTVCGAEASCNNWQIRHSPALTSPTMSPTNGLREADGALFALVQALYARVQDYRGGRRNDGKWPVRIDNEELVALLNAIDLTPEDHAAALESASTATGEGDRFAGAGKGIPHSAEREAAIRRGVARCIEIARETRDGFLSPEYATDQPMSSFQERFACDQVAQAIENEFALGTIEQCQLLGKPTPFDQHAAAIRSSASPPDDITYTGLGNSQDSGGGAERG